MFTPTHNSLIFSKLAIILLLPAARFASAQEDFKFQPAQPNLSEIYLQMARSLEHHGHIEPYFRHVLSEHERIGRLYEAKLGKKMIPYLPSYMTEKYITDLLASWEELSPKLSLPKMARKSGRLVRLAIDGENGKGTTLRLIFNRHQDAVYRDMVDGGQRDVGFIQLKTELLQLARSGETALLAKREDKLTELERKHFLALIAKPRFSKTDFQALESFYDGPYDKLTEVGKSLLSARVAAGQKGVDAMPTDAVKFSKELLEMYQSIFRQLDEQLSEKSATAYVDWITHVIAEVGRLSEVELQLAIVERDLKKK